MTIELPIKLPATKLTGNRQIKKKFILEIKFILSLKN